MWNVMAVEPILLLAIGTNVLSARTLTTVPLVKRKVTTHMPSWRSQRLVKPLRPFSLSLMKICQTLRLILRLTLKNKIQRTMPAHGIFRIFLLSSKVDMMLNQLEANSMIIRDTHIQKIPYVIETVYIKRLVTSIQATRTKALLSRPLQRFWLQLLVHVWSRKLRWGTTQTVLTSQVSHFWVTSRVKPPNSWSPSLFLLTPTKSCNPRPTSRSPFPCRSPQMPSKVSSSWPNYALLIVRVSLLVNQLYWRFRLFEL